MKDHAASQPASDDAGACGGVSRRSNDGRRGAEEQAPSKDSNGFGRLSLGIAQADEIIADRVQALDPA
jgi:hypothetical protein